MDGLLEPLEVLPFDHEAPDCYARVRFERERIGRPIRERDLLIALIALALGLTIATHNVPDFGRVPGHGTEDRL